MNGENHHLRAIFVLGPSSSGKTTLCEAISERLGINAQLYIKEIARRVMLTHGFTRNDTDTFEMQHAIMVSQLAAERAAIAFAESMVRSMPCSGSPPTVLSDRSAVDPVVYATTSDAPGASERRQRLLNDRTFQDNLTWYRKALFVVLEPVEEWIEDDGVRSLEDPWKYSQVLHATLAELHIPWMVLGAETKDLQARVDCILGGLEKVDQVG